MGGTRPRLWPEADERLVAAVRRGDDGAFERVYDRHAAELLSFCRYMLGSRHEAEDALQQTFLKAYKALRRSQKEITLRPWLYAIARNECVSALRRREVPAAAIDPGSTEGLASEVERREELKSMLRDIARLPGEQREALLLSSVQTLPGQQVAEILGTDRDRVKALVFRARQSLSHSRDARDVNCSDIRAQLSVLRGGSLRRKVLREHLLECDGCREFRHEVRRQRQLIGALLPVPLPLTLKAGSLTAASAGVGNAVTAGGATGGVLALGTSGVAAKVAVGVAGIAAVAAGSTAISSSAEGGPPAREAGTLTAPGAGVADLTGGSATETPASRSETSHGDAGRGRSADGSPGRDPGSGGGGAGGGGSQGTAGTSATTGPDGGHTASQGPAPAGEAAAAPGPTGTPPGHGGESPGHSVPAPGHGGTPPGHGGTPPGHGGTPPGHGGTSPGHAGSAAPPADTGAPPGHGGVPPGHGGTPPGQAGRPAAELGSPTTANDG
jgi:RNA polymerase sigma factor (sigma-70 family)